MDLLTVQGIDIEYTKPHPKCLFVHRVRADEPLYVACGFDGYRAHIITVHWLDPENWIDWRTRRS